MAIEVRYATHKDAEMIAELSRKTFQDTFAAFNTKEDMQLFLDSNFNKQLLMEEVVTERNIFLLAYNDGQLAGYARLREDNNPEQLQGIPTLEIARIYATSEAIGTGIGKTLMEKAIEIARQRGKQILWLGVWEKNQRAIDFYTRWGFEKFSDHEFVLGKDIQNDWLMKRNVT